MFDFDMDRIKNILTQLGQSGDSQQCAAKESEKKTKSQEKQECINLSPVQLLVLAGIIGGMLDVESVLVDNDQGVEIVLSGSLKRTTQLDQVMEQIMQLPFEQVVQSILGSGS